MTMRIQVLTMVLATMFLAGCAQRSITVKDGWKPAPSTVETMAEAAKKREHPPLSVTFLPARSDFISKDGGRLSLSDVAELAKGRDYILIGEGHRSETDHQVQQLVLAALASSEHPPAVGLEMVSVDKQHVLDDFNAGIISVSELEEELEWKIRWGYPFDLFQGLFEQARRNSLPVHGLNSPPAVTRTVSRKGLDALDDVQKSYMPSELVWPSNEQTELLQQVFSQHSFGSEDDNGTQFERFLAAQSIWDSKMAEEAVKVRKKYDWPVLIIAGNGHVERGWGIARRLARFDPEASVLLLVPYRGGEFVPEDGDAFFYSPDMYESRLGMTLVVNGGDGLLVQSVKRASRAAEAGFRPGDVLVSANGVDLVALMALHKAGKKAHDEDVELVFQVRRRGETFPVTVGKLGKARPKVHPAPFKPENSENKE